VTTNFAIAAIHIGMIPIIADKTKTKIVEMIIAHPGVLTIAQETAFIKKELAMIKDVRAEIALIIQARKKV
jgi:hypothetical protein